MRLPTCPGSTWLTLVRAEWPDLDRNRREFEECWHPDKWMMIITITITIIFLTWSFITPAVSLCTAAATTSPEGWQNHRSSWGKTEKCGTRICWFLVCFWIQIVVMAFCKRFSVMEKSIGGYRTFSNVANTNIKYHNWLRIPVGAWKVRQNTVWRFYCLAPMHL